MAIDYKLIEHVEKLFHAAKTVFKWYLLKFTGIKIERKYETISDFVRKIVQSGETPSQTTKNKIILACKVLI